MAMSVSLKKATSKTNIKHNNRTMNDKEKERNAHIEYSRSHENQYLVQEDIKKLYEREFGDALEKYNAKQKRSDRKIKDYYKHIQASKKTSTQQEMIIQVGDKDDFSSGENFALANEILQEWFNGFEKRNPNLKVYNAVIHNDEASPHMHLNFVPVADGYKRGLERQVAFDRAIKQQDPTLNKSRPFEDWREKEVQLLAEMLKERGIERKFVGTNEYKDVNEYKQKKDQLREIENKLSDKHFEINKLENEKESLEKSIHEKKNEMLEMSSQVPADFKVKAKKEKKKEIKKVGLFKTEKVVKDTGRLVIELEEYERMKKTFKAAATIKNDYERLQTTDLVKENKELRKKANRFQYDNNQLKRDNDMLRSRNRLLQGQIGDLRHEIGLIYKGAKEFVREHFGNVQGAMNRFMSNVRSFVRSDDFEHEHKQGAFSMRGVREMEKDLQNGSKKNKNRSLDLER